MFKILLELLGPIYRMITFNLWLEWLNSMFMKLSNRVNIPRLALSASGPPPPKKKQKQKHTQTVLETLKAEKKIEYYF